MLVMWLHTEKWGRIHFGGRVKNDNGLWPAEKESLFEPAEDKIYRHPTFMYYTGRTKTHVIYGQQFEKVHPEIGGW